MSETPQDVHVGDLPSVQPSIATTVPTEMVVSGLPCKSGVCRVYASREPAKAQVDVGFRRTFKLICCLQRRHIPPCFGIPLEREPRALWRTSRQAAARARAK